jgi:hypothetical protein
MTKGFLVVLQPPSPDAEDLSGGRRIISIGAGSPHGSSNGADMDHARAVGIRPSMIRRQLDLQLVLILGMAVVAGRRRRRSRSGGSATATGSGRSGGRDRVRWIWQPRPGPADLAAPIGSGGWATMTASTVTSMERSLTWI